ncbi:hypothetical protein GCK72_003635 [Caenorhabditis remanei]|nr:hypothetical protein GCK72_003635 [Caenorhabditis remanei]KAF1763690.1 hypothetical protein GCK72_003635 [Caenorhabditis remanei]
MAKEEKAEDIEKIQTKMMSEYFRSKAREHKKLKKVMDKAEKNKKSVVETRQPFQPLTSPTADPCDVLHSIETKLMDNQNDSELIGIMDFLIPVVIGMFTSSPHWLVRDKAIDCLRSINRKMGRSLIDKHLNTVSKKQKVVLENLL